MWSFQWVMWSFQWKSCGHFNGNHVVISMKVMWSFLWKSCGHFYESHVVISIIVMWSFLWKSCGHFNEHFYENHVVISIKVLWSFLWKSCGHFIESHVVFWIEVNPDVQVYNLLFYFVFAYWRSRYEEGSQDWIRFKPCHFVVSVLSQDSVFERFKLARGMVHVIIVVLYIVDHYVFILFFRPHFIFLLTRFFYCSVCKLVYI